MPGILCAFILHLIGPLKLINNKSLFYLPRRTENNVQFNKVTTMLPQSLLCPLSLVRSMASAYSHSLYGFILLLNILF